MTPFQEAALKLHRYMLDHHWREQALLGPDPGIRLNYRIGRFVKSYLGDVLGRDLWKDDLYYLQGQGYWVLGNWELFRRTGDAPFAELAVAASRTMLARQRDDGAWPYPNPEWKGRVATAEGTWGSLGLVESYRQTGEQRFLDGALAWHRFLTETVGFQRMDDTLAINYFAGMGKTRVPNNTAFVLRFLAELADVTGDAAFCQPCPGLMRFMAQVQTPSGEFPYAVPGVDGGPLRPHFQCFQYNAFQCLDLMRYQELTQDAAALPVIEKVLGFLAGGLSPEGYAYYECGNRHRRVTYHAAVLAAAFWRAGELGMGGYQELADRAYRYVLGQQRADGGFPYSQGDYRLLRDNRSYPRYLAMILVHLLAPDATGPDGPGTLNEKEETHAPVR